MKQVDMSAKAVTARLKLVAQLRRLGLSLQKAKFPSEENHAKMKIEEQERPSQADTLKAK
jgi:hypothetical protein